MANFCPNVGTFLGEPLRERLDYGVDRMNP